MVKPLLDVSTFAREPEFHLGHLLDVLSCTPDGHRDVVVPERGFDHWDCDAGGYVINVNANYQCGFDEEGDGKVLTVITQRVANTGGMLVISTVPVQLPAINALNLGPFVSINWQCTVMLGADCRAEELDIEVAGQAGRGCSSHPGTAALLAYLRALGTLSHNPGKGER